MKTFSSYLFILSGLFLACSSARLNEKLSSFVEDVEFVRSTSHCTEVAARALFTLSNDLSIVASNLSHHSSGLLREIIVKTFANKSVKLFTKFSIHATPRSGLHERTSSFLVIDSTANLRRLMRASSAERWSEYIIIVNQTTNKWLSEFSYYLSKLGFVNIAFIRVTAKGRNTLIRPMVNPSSKISLPTLKIFDICDADSSSNTTKISCGNSIVLRSFSCLQDRRKRTLSFARILEGTEDPKLFGQVQNGKITSFGVDILRLFAEKHNIELERYEWTNQSESTWLDAMYRCLAGEFDYFYAVLPPSRKAANEDIEAVAWYKYEAITFVDSPKKPTLSSSNILVPYQGIVWFCTLVIFGAFALFSCSIDYLWQRGLVRERITVLAIWSIFVDQSLPRLPVKSGLRFVLGIWIVHNLVRNAGYSALFSSSLTATDGSYLLKSFRDILDSGKPICGSSKAKQLLNDPNDTVIYGIHKRFQAIPPKMVFDAVFNGSCIGTRHLSFVEMHNTINRANESRRLYTLDEAVILEYPSFYFAKKYNPYNNEFKRFVSRAHEVGLIKREKLKYSVKLDRIRDESSISTDGQFLKLAHLLILFEILCVGHLVSIVVFLIEIYVHARSVKKFTNIKS